MKKLLSAARPFFLKLLFVLPIAVGAMLLALAVKARTGPEKTPEREIARSLRVVEIQQIPYVPRAAGYGASRPTQIWQAIAEVKGRVSEIHPDLKTGSFIEKGSVLARIDEIDTELAIRKLNAEIAKAQSSISELDANKQNFEASVGLERQAVQVAQQELERISLLLKRNAGAQAEFDAAERALITQKQKVQGIVNSLNLLPAQLDSAKAILAVAEASLQERERDLERIVIQAPFDCRIGPVQLELGQFIPAGTILFEAQSTEQIEVEAQLAVRNMRPLFDEALRRKDMARGQTEMNQAAVKRYFNVQATVRYSVGGERYERVASFERIREELESQTRLMGVIVTIDRPFANLAEGPPPVSGTYCEVELRGKPRPSQVVIPRAAIRGNDVYLVDQDSRLQRRRISVETTQAEFAIIESGLEVGDVLVVSDPTPAVGGMLVEPVVDDRLMESIRRQASGEGILR